jgi:hypothetical protein
VSTLSSRRKTTPPSSKIGTCENLECPDIVLGGVADHSISPAHVEAVKAYIANQEEHHKTISFQDEFCRLLVKYGVEYDERCVWD